MWSTTEFLSNGRAGWTYFQNLSLKDRKKVLSSISYIDYIIDFSEKDPSKLILELNPNILVKGSDYKINQIINYKKILKKGIQISLIEHYNNKSTSNIIKNINNLW